MTRKLNANTIKPVLRHIAGWGNDIHSLNTPNADFYEFTLDVYNGKNSFSGGMTWGLDGCYDHNGEPHEAYAIDLKTGEVYDLATKLVIMEVQV